MPPDGKEPPDRSSVGRQGIEIGKRRRLRRRRAVRRRRRRSGRAIFSGENGPKLVGDLLFPVWGICRLAVWV